MVFAVYLHLKVRSFIGGIVAGIFHLPHPMESLWAIIYTTEKLTSKMDLKNLLVKRKNLL